MSKPKKQVSAVALIARINRKLAHEGERLRTTRGARAEQELGTYYVVDVNRNTPVRYPFYANDLVKLGRELGVLRTGESLAAEK